MAWKTISPATAGDSTQFAGNDINKISNLFNGVADVDYTSINSDWDFRTGRLRIANPAYTFVYVFDASAITANRSMTLPLLAANDTFVFANHIQALTNKTIDGSVNSIQNLGNANIALHTSTKISITDKTHLASTIAHTDQSNTFGSFDQKFKSGNLLLAGGSFNYLFSGSTITANRNVTLPVLTADDTFQMLNVAQTQINKTINLTNNTVNDTGAATGDMMRFNGTRYVRWAKGSALQVPRTNSSATDIEWVLLSSVSEAFQNKAIDAYTNTFSHIHQMPSSSNKTGQWLAQDVAANSGEGLLYKVTPAASQTNSVSTGSTGNGMLMTTNAVGGANAGMRNTVLNCCRAQNPRLKVRFSLGQDNISKFSRLFIGFTSNAASEPSDSDNDLQSKSGVFFGFRANDTNFFVSHNDGTGTPPPWDTTGVSNSAGTVREIEIFADNANSRWGWNIDNGANNYITTRIPASTTGLTAVFMLQTSSTLAANRTWTVYYAEQEQIK